MEVNDHHRSLHTRTQQLVVQHAVVECLWGRAVIVASRRTPGHQIREALIFETMRQNLTVNRVNHLFLKNLWCCIPVGKEREIKDGGSMQSNSGS
jgi:hypothetical protein